MENGVENTMTSETISLFGERTGVSYTCVGSGSLNVYAVSNASNALLPNPSHDSFQERKLLFAEHIWPGCLVMADYITEISERGGIPGLKVLELGAGAALPSLLARRLGAELVVASDFPDDVILDHIKFLAKQNNIDVSNDESNSEVGFGFFVEGHAWGTDCQPLLKHLPPSVDGFDLVILAECLWKDTYSLHRKLLQSAFNCLSKQNPHAEVLVSFAHRPCETHQPQHDLEFFETATKEYDFMVELVKVVTKYTDAMDSNDLVDVHLYRMRQSTKQ